MAEITYGENGKEGNNPESALKDVETGLKELGEHDRKYKEVVHELLEKVPSNKSPSYWSKIFEWCTKVRQTLTTDNILKGLNAVGKKIYNGILKAVDYLVKICKRKRSMEEVSINLAPNKTPRDPKGYRLNAKGAARQSSLNGQEEKAVLYVSPLYAEKKEAARKKEAATKIQAAYRGMTGRQTTKDRRDLQELNAMANTLELYNGFQKDRSEVKKQWTGISDQTAKMVGRMINGTEEKDEKFNKKPAGKNSEAALSQKPQAPKRYRSHNFTQELLNSRKEKGGGKGR